MSVTMPTLTVAEVRLYEFTCRRSGRFMYLRYVETKHNAEGEAGYRFTLADDPMQVKFLLTRAELAGFTWRRLAFVEKALHDDGRQLYWFEHVAG